MQFHGQGLGGDKQLPLVTCGAKTHETKTCPHFTYPYSLKVKASGTPYSLDGFITHFDS